MPRTTLPVVELFGPTIQGEGALCGAVSYFVRFFGCQYRCNWCDSLHAVLPEHRRKAEELSAKGIVSRLKQLNPQPNSWVTLTGGDPCLWDLTELIIELKKAGFRVAVETQGAIFREWLTNTDLVTCSPKPSSAGMDHKLSLKTLQHYQARLKQLILKIVVFNDTDFDFAEKMHKFMRGVPLYLTSGSSPPGEDVSAENYRAFVLPQYAWATDTLLKRPSLHDVRLSPQMHTLIWGGHVGH